MKNNYNEGDLFGVPISTSEFIIGLIVKVNNNKMLCYFFSRKVSSLTDSKIEIERDEVLLVIMCSALGLDKKHWKLIGRYNNWDAKDWKVPNFKRIDIITNKCYEIIYNDSLEEIDSKEVADCASLDDFPEDGLAGYGYVEKRLSRLLTF